MAEGLRVRDIEDASAWAKRGPMSLAILCPVVSVITNGPETSHLCSPQGPTEPNISMREEVHIVGASNDEVQLQEQKISTATDDSRISRD